MLEPGGRVAAAMVNGGFVRPPSPPPRERKGERTVARERRGWRTRGGYRVGLQERERDYIRETREKRRRREIQVARGGKGERVLTRRVAK